MQVQFKQAKAAFFDKPAVLRAVSRARRRNLSKSGAYLRKRARSSLRRRKKTSPPGRPPSVHSDDDFATLKNILFAYDESIDGVVVGPVKLNGHRDRVPELMEKGGHAIRRGRYVSERTKRGKKRVAVRFQRTKQPRAVHYEQRPFMAPALRQELPRLASQWRDSVKG